jgi:hypothetical protein
MRQEMIEECQSENASRAVAKVQMRPAQKFVLAKISFINQMFSYRFLTT